MIRKELQRQLDLHCEFCQVAGIVKAGGDFVTRQVGEFSDDLSGSLACCQVTKNQARRDGRSLDAGFAAKNLRVAYDVIFPVNRQGSLLLDIEDTP